MKKIILIATIMLPALCVAQGKVGENTNTPSDTLDVNGSVNFRGAVKVNGSPGQPNQVLMSTGPGGDPQWKSTAYTGGGRFLITLSTNYNSFGGPVGRGKFDIASDPTQEDSVDYSTTAISGTDFTISNPGLANNYITINRAGLYHFEGTLRLTVSSTSGVPMYPRAVVRLLANQTSAIDLNIVVLDEAMNKSSGTETGGTNNVYVYDARFSINTQLTSGATATFLSGFANLRFPNGTELISLGQLNSGYISGHFISE